MGKTKDFDNILEECLERVLRKGETVEQCLSSHPEQSAELEPLLRTAVAARQVSAIRPRPEFRNRARYEFGLAVRRAQEKQGRHLFFWQPRWATVAIAVLVLVVGGSGTLAAASNSMPDEPLYAVKLTAEAMRINLTPSALGKAQLYAALADKRVAEIVRMAEKDKPAQVERATERLDAYLERAASLSAPAQKQAGALIAPSPAPAPSVTAPVPRPEKAPALATPTPVPAPTPRAPTAVTSPTKAKQNDDQDRDAADKRAKVRATVVSSAAKQKEALEAALKKAPESAKPALRQALAVSAIRNKAVLDALDK